MRLKENVKFGNVHSAISVAMIICNEIFIKHAYEFIVTSFNDSTHSTNSLHYKDAAFDLRSKHIPSEEEKLEILQEMKESLTTDFDVLYESQAKDNQHYHIEYQPK